MREGRVHVVGVLSSEAEQAEEAQKGVVPPVENAIVSRSALCDASGDLATL